MNDPVVVDLLELDPTVTAGAYTANDVVGGLLEFAEAFPIPGQGILITDITIVDQADVLDAAAAYLLFLDKQPAASVADNAAGSTISDDDGRLAKLVPIATTDWQDVGGFAVATLRNVNLSMRPTGPDTSLFAYLITSGTPTFAATDDVRIKLGVIRQ